jgi:glutaredoxin
MSEWIVYSKPECSLCDEMTLALSELLGERGKHVRVIDISADPELQRLYGQKIPALVIDGELVCKYRLQRERVERYLADSGAPFPLVTDSG